MSRADTKGKKLPAGLPPLPAVLEGYAGWEYMGKGYASKDGEPYRFFDPTCGHWSALLGHLGGLSTANRSLHYIRAIKRPAAKPSKAKPACNGRVVAKRMWSTDYPYCSATITEGRVTAASKPVFVLPADAESVERMVEQGAEAISGNPGWAQFDEKLRELYRATIRTALAAVGLRAAKKGARKS